MKAASMRHLQPTIQLMLMCWRAIRLVAVVAKRVHQRSALVRIKAYFEARFCLPIVEGWVVAPQDVDSGRAIHHSPGDAAVKQRAETAKQSIKNCLSLRCQTAFNNRLAFVTC
jgi:hypothetical protein